MIFGRAFTTSKRERMIEINVYIAEGYQDIFDIDVAVDCRRKRDRGISHRLPTTFADVWKIEQIFPIKVFFLFS